MASLGMVIFLLWPDETVWLATAAAGIGTTAAFSVAMAAPAALAPARRVGLVAGGLLSIGYIEATIGPLALGSLRDAFGSYTVGWLLVLVLSLVLTATAWGVPGERSSAA